MSARPSSGARRRPSHAPSPAFAAAILDTLESAHPEATCALHYGNPYELVMATILSAQCTDERVNQVTPALFARYPDAARLAVAHPADVESIIRSTGFFRAKTRSLIGCAQALVSDHGGVVPASMEALVRLPGVGRKTASVVLGHVFGISEGIAVDTHVLRVSNRLGLAHSDDPLKVEQQLMALIPQERWTRTTDLIIFHGRKICDARRPECGRCPLFGLCRWESRQSHSHGALPSRKVAPPKPQRKRR